jgi:hypothetical protein
MPSVFIGTVDQIVADMLARREQFGFSYYVVADDQREEMAPVVKLLGRFSTSSPALRYSSRG